MDTLRGIAEHEEADWGESIIARDEALAILDQEPGLGPPDLVWLQKAPPGSASGRGVARSYYHYILGKEVTSCASVAAYFAQLSNLVEPPSFFQGLWSSGQRKVDRGFYCCYEPLSRLDIRCELCVPGGVSAAAVDSEGNLHEVTDWLWARCQLAAFIRAELLDAELVAHAASNLQRYDPLLDPVAEKNLLKVIQDLYCEGVLPGGLDALAYDQAGGCTAEQMDIVLCAVLHHFGRRQRWSSAAAFFEGLAEHYCAATVYLAAALRELGQGDKAMELLKQAADREPFHAQVLVALATEYMFENQLEAALKLCRRAVRAAPGLRPCWLLLARCYARTGELQLALLALNCTPPPSLPIDEEGLLFVVPPPKPKSRTKPKCPPYDFDIMAAMQLLSEDAGALPEEAGGDGERPLVYLPGAVLVNREPPDRAAWADVAPYRGTRATLATVYGVLQEIVASSGWDDFLDIRSDVFIMYNEGSAPGEEASDLHEGDAEECEDGAAGGGDAFPALPERGRAEEGAPRTADGGPLPTTLEVARTWWRTNLQGEDKLHSPRLVASPGQQVRGVGSFLADTVVAAEVVADLLDEPAAAVEPVTPGAEAQTPSPATETVSEDALAASTPVPEQPSPSLLAVFSQEANPAGIPDPTAVSTPTVLSAQSDVLAAATALASTAAPTTPAAVPPPAVASASSTPGPRGFQAVRLPGMARRLAPASHGATPHLLSAPVLAAPHLGSGIAVDSAVGRKAPPAATGAALEGAPPPPPLPSFSLLARAVSDAGSGALPGSGDAAATAKSAAAHLIPPKTPGLWNQLIFEAGTGRPGPVAEGTLPTSRHTTATHPSTTRHAAPSELWCPDDEVSAGAPSASCAHPGRPDQSRHDHQQGSTCRSYRLAESAVAAPAFGQQQQPASTAGHGHGVHEGVGRRCPAGPVAEATGPADERRRSGNNMRLHVHDALLEEEYLTRNHSPAEARDEPRGKGRAARRSEVLRLAEEMDREAAVVGKMPGTTDDQEAAGAPKRVCVRWLDELIVSFWHDLQAYLEWQALDRDLVSVCGLGHAGILLDLPIPPEAPEQDPVAEGEAGAGGAGPVKASRSLRRALPRAPPEPHFLLDEEREALLVRVPPLSCGDWVRRGLLAERLYHDDQALLAYRAALEMGFSLVAYNALMRLTAINGMASQTLQAVHHVMEWHDLQHSKLLLAQPGRTQPGIHGARAGLPGQPSPAKAKPGAKPGPMAAPEALLPPVEGAYMCPLPVLCSVCMLVSVVGVEALVAAQVELGFAIHPAVRELLDTIKMWA